MGEYQGPLHKGECVLVLFQFKLMNVPDGLAILLASRLAEPGNQGGLEFRLREHVRWDKYLERPVEES